MGPDNLPNLNAGEVRLPAWSVAEGWPTCIDFYEQRLVAGATPEEPQYIWASESGNFESFHPGDNDSDSVYFRPATSKMNAILWLLGASHLLFGTTGAEFSAQGGSDAILTPGDVAVKRRTGIGSAAIQAQLLDQGVVHVQRHGKKVRELLYDYDTYSYTSTDLTLFSEHITGDGVVAFDTTFQPYPILWFVRSDGQLCACTYSRDIGVVAWHRHVTDGEYESLATISGNGRDEVWVVVKREVDGTVKRMIEVFTAEPETLEDSFYVDCGLTYDGAATTRVTGLHHLIGEEVAILADGAVHPPQTVAADGTLTLTLAAEKVHAGLPYTATMETLRINPGAPEGDSLSRRRRISQVDIDFYRTVNAVVYANTGSRLVRAPFRTVGDTMGQAIPWFTGIKDIKPQGEWNNEGTVKVVQDEPLPMTIRALVPRIEIGDA